MRSVAPSCLLVAPVLLVLTTLAAVAQMDVNPIEFDYDRPRVGVEIGLSSAQQQGIYRTGCGEFTKGARLNPLLAVAYDYPIVNKVLRFEGLLGFQWKSLSSVYNSREQVVLQSGGQHVFVDVDFENKGTASLSYLFLMPSLKFYLARGLYLGGGLSAGLSMGATTQYTKTILSRTVVIQDLGLSEVTYAPEESSDPYTRVFPEEDRSDASSFAIDAVAFAGAEFRVGPRLFIGPRLLFGYPLNNVFSDPELKVLSFQFLVGARYDLMFQ